MTGKEINKVTNKLSWSIMTLAAAAISLYALAAAIVPGMRADFVQNMIANTASSAITHFLGGGIVLLVGALQFHAGLRRNRPSLHRICGYIYVVGVIVGGIAGLYLAFYSTGGIVAHWGFGTLAVCWLGATSTAFMRIRAGQVRLHQDWMIRSYALTLAAVTLRVYLPISQIAGYGFEESYQAISWLCWVPNILIAEWILIPRSNRRSSN